MSVSVGFLLRLPSMCLKLARLFLCLADLDDLTDLTDLDDFVDLDDLDDLTDEDLRSRENARFGGPLGSK